MPSSSIFLVSKCTIVPEQNSTIKSLKLSISDLPMLSCQYIQKGVLFNLPPYSINDLINSLKQSLAVALVHFPALAGHLVTDDDGHVHIVCNDAGVDFVQAKAKHVSVDAIHRPDDDVPDCFKEFFAFDRTLSYSGHFKPLTGIEVTELADGVFIGCTVNNAVTDGTSFWHFFNTFAEICKGAKKISTTPDFSRDNVFNSQAVLRFPTGGPKVTFSGDEPLRERIFHFSSEAIQRLKVRANYKINILRTSKATCNGFMNPDSAEFLGKKLNDRTGEISSFQSLCAQLWRSVTRVRKLVGTKITTFRMAVNCRHRVCPPMESHYFGNAIQSIPTFSIASDLLANDLGWCADLLYRNVVSHDDATVRRGVEYWERQPRLFPLGNFDGAPITMGARRGSLCTTTTSGGGSRLR